MRKPQKLGLKGILFAGVLSLVFLGGHRLSLVSKGQETSGYGFRTPCKTKADIYGIIGKSPFGIAYEDFQHRGHGCSQIYPGGPRMKEVIFWKIPTTGNGIEVDVNQAISDMVKYSQDKSYFSPNMLIEKEYCPKMELTPKDLGFLKDQNPKIVFDKELDSEWRDYIDKSDK